MEAIAGAGAPEEQRKRVLVTGASGFIASHLTRRLVREGHADVAITTRYGNLIKNTRLADIWPSLHVIEADLRNRGALAQIKAWQPHIVYHLAAYNHVGMSFVQVEECFDVNAKGTANLLDICEESGIDKFVYVSTSEVYGPQEEIPFQEWMRPNPSSPYAVTKYAGELYCALKQKMGMPISIVRPFNCYGPSQSAKAVIPSLIFRMLSDQAIPTTLGEQTREFNYVDDVVSGIIRAGEAKYTGPINLCSGTDVSIRALTETLRAKTVTSSEIEYGAMPYRPNEIWVMRGSNKLAKELLGWAPKISLDDGLELTIKWAVDELEGRHDYRPDACTK